VADIELRLLRYFIAVVDEGGISRAAEHLKIAQPAVSRAMRALEDAIGVPLLSRGSSHAVPTQAGTVLAEEARAVLRRVDLLTERVTAVETADYRIRCAAQIGDAALAAELAGGFACHIDMSAVVEIVPRNPGTVTAALDDAECDVALLRWPFDTRGLDRELLWSEPRVVLLAVGHPLAGRDRVELSHLHDEPICIWPAMSGPECEHWAGADLDRHVWRPGPVLSSAADVLAAVQLGRAIAFVPRSVARPGTVLPGVAIRPVDGLSPSELYLAWPATSTSLAMARFVQHAVAHTAQNRNGHR
jgi:DNA-binding transcriptional LysR family regulator